MYIRLSSIVSSPQGNATNLGMLKVMQKKFPRFKSPRECYKHPNHDFFFTACSNTFQVPKGMLQTIRMTTLRNVIPFVSSPQGNATNPKNTVLLFSQFSSFKSPRECYKQSRLTIPPLTDQQFQVPKGMLQTLGYPSGSTMFLRFKSPRECYKPNPSGSTRSMGFMLVSSPQGNATNPTITPEDGGPMQFQVPKGMLQTLLTIILL